MYSVVLETIAVLGTERIINSFLTALQRGHGM